MRLKAQWIVKAGIVPGQPFDQFTRRWEYTSIDDEEDRTANPEGRIDPSYHSIFAKKRAEALDYYLQVSQPYLNNWASLEFLWL